MTTAYRSVYEHDDGLRIDLQAADIAISTGETRRLHRLVTGNGWGAVAIGVRATGVDDEILFISSYRPAVGATLLELPRGWAEPVDADGDDGPAVAAALRELVEETGYAGRGGRVLGSFVVDSSIYPQRVSVVQTVVEPVAVAEPDGEAATIEWVPRSRIAELMLRGVVHDALTLAALALMQAHQATIGEGMEAQGR